jgi:phage shock protein A
MATTRLDDLWESNPYGDRPTEARRLREADEERLAMAIKKQYENQLKRKDEEIQLLKDQNEFLNKRIEDLKNYGALFKEYHGDKI